ncbi:MAG: TraR/DksA family transcriptional regulator [Planctomycetota bacterium]
MAKKKTTKKAAASKKKTSKKTSSRTTKTTSKKKVTKKAASKKTAAKKPSTKKSTAKKAATTKKKPAAKSEREAETPDASSKSQTTKKTSSKVGTSKKKTSKKTAAKSDASKGSSKKKTTSKSKSDANSESGAESPKRFGWSSSKDIKSAQSVAKKLAAAAGLQPPSTRDDGDLLDEDTPRLKKSPLTKKQLAKFREILLAKWREIVGDVESMESEALTGGGSGSLSHLPQHMADQGSDTYEQTLNLDLAQSQRMLLAEIAAALQRIDEGTYGICETTGREIGLERLEYNPWARHSIEAARRLEGGAYSQQ